MTLPKLIIDFPKHIDVLEEALGFEPNETRVELEFNKFNSELSKIKDSAKNPEILSQLETTLGTVKSIAITGMGPGVVTQLFTSIKEIFTAASQELQAA